MKGGGNAGERARRDGVDEEGKGKDPFRVGRWGGCL